MSVRGHGDEKYDSELLESSAEWDGLRVERRHVAAGVHTGLTAECTEIVFILSGQSGVQRTGDGKTQVGIARPGTSWLCPAGVRETQIDTDRPTETLHIYLPSVMLDHSATADFDLDPAGVHLSYIGALADPTLAHLALLLHKQMRRDRADAGQLFIEGIRTALAAHLMGHYDAGSGPKPLPAVSLDPRRLQRVIDFIDASLGEDLTLGDLAGQACLSPFHFSRLFREATGKSPHRYLVDKRIEAGQRMLVKDQASLANIALDTGFGSQSHFTRAFRKVVGMTPGSYRKLHRGQAIPA